ncbi:hypothetical protein E4U58_005465 [Claviceps cyperi]|nr:hypothetical protein E4U58_005465 [Claviceps cyperi]
MYVDEPMSTDKTSHTGYDAKIKLRNHHCLIDDVAEKPGEESSRSRNGDTAPGALAEQTKNLRAVLSTHRESRSIAVRKYPDELFMETASGASIIRFRKETDVIFLSELATEKEYFILECGSEIENLAVGVVDDYSEERYFQDDTLLQVVPRIKGLFPNLKRLFSRRPAPTRHTDTEEWCATEHVYSYMTESHYKTTLFYWPNLDAHPDFARSSVPKLCSLEEMEEAGVELWPMVEFESWKPLQTLDGPEFEDDSSSTDGIYSYDKSSADGSDSDERFPCLRLEDVQVSTELDVKPYSRLHIRKAIVMATDEDDDDDDDDDENEMGHDEDGDRS